MSRIGYLAIPPHRTDSPDPSRGRTDEWPSPSEMIYRTYAPIAVAVRVDSASITSRERRLTRCTQAPPAPRCRQRVNGLNEISMGSLAAWLQVGQWTSISLGVHDRLWSSAPRCLEHHRSGLGAPGSLGMVGTSHCPTSSTVSLHLREQHQARRLVVRRAVWVPRRSSSVGRAPPW
jgi:hypothetical protein